MPQTLACETGFPILATRSCGVLFSHSVLLSLVWSGARLVFSDVFFPFPPSFHPVSFPHQSAWHPACLRDEETPQKAEKYIKKSALGFCFSTAKASSRKKHTGHEKLIWKKTWWGDILSPYPHSPTRPGVFPVGKCSREEGCMDTDGSQRGAVPCSPMQTEIQQGQGVTEGSGTWEGLECVDLWKWQDGREDVSRLYRVLCERCWVSRCPRVALTSHKGRAGPGGNKGLLSSKSTSKTTNPPQSKNLKVLWGVEWGPWEMLQEAVHDAAELSPNLLPDLRPGPRSWPPWSLLSLTDVHEDQMWLSGAGTTQVLRNLDNLKGMGGGTGGMLNLLKFNFCLPKKV